MSYLVSQPWWAYATGGAIIVLLLLLLMWLLWSWLRRRRACAQAAAAAAQAAARERERLRAEAAAEEQARRLADRQKKVGDILQADPSLVKCMFKQAGLEHRPLHDVSTSAADVAAIAARLSDDQVASLWLAARQKDIEFALKREQERVPSLYPTSDIEPEVMDDLAQLTAVIPEQFMMDDDAFYSSLATQQLNVLQPYETKDRRRRLYVLLDVSGSMADLMADNRPRHVWARGVTVSLLLKAVADEAEYFLRTFDGECHDLIEVTDPRQAEAAIEAVLKLGFAGGGTDISGAISRAVRDIRACKSEVEASDLLLVSDGADDKIDVAAIKKMLGDGINLHLALIGAESASLRQIAKSCRVFR